MARRKDIHWSDVKAGLEKRGSCLAAIALQLGISGAAVTKVKRMPNARVQHSIAKALDTTPEVIWPTRYYIASGKPMRPSIWLKNNSRVTTVAHVKNERVA